MLIKTIPVGHLETNCYIVTNEETLECVVIDPGDESNTILDSSVRRYLSPTVIMIIPEPQMLWLKRPVPGYI